MNRGIQWIQNGCVFCVVASDGDIIDRYPYQAAYWSGSRIEDVAAKCEDCGWPYLIRENLIPFVLGCHE